MKSVSPRSVAGTLGQGKRICHSASTSTAYPSTHALARSEIPPNLQERETKDGHYLYQCAPPFAELGCGPWSNGGQVHNWLNGLVRQQGEGRPLRLWGRSSSPPATAMDWQASAAGAG